MVDVGGAVCVGVVGRFERCACGIEGVGGKGRNTSSPEGRVLERGYCRP